MHSVLPTFAHPHHHARTSLRHKLQASLPLLGAALGLSMLLTGVASASGGARPIAQTPVGTGGVNTTASSTTLGSLGVLFSGRLPSSLHARPVTTKAHRTRRPAHIWVRPDVGPLTSPFGMRWGRLHPGIDLAGPYGSPIRAATDGVVSFIGQESGYGNLILIRDWDGTTTAYAHLAVFITRGGRVHAGQIIALEGATGDATGPHLHFEVRINGRPVNPIPFLRHRGVFV